MMSRWTQSLMVATATFVLLTLSPARDTTAASDAQPAPPAIDALFATWNRSDSPGCAVGVARRGRTIYEHGFGMASLESGARITPASVFHVASVSKQFTAMSILLLADAGKLRLDDQVRQYVPGWADGSGVTIRHLLTHTGGLRDAFLLTELAAPHDGSIRTSDRLVTLLARQRGLNFTPGSEYQYSNGGYLLLASIVERVSGQSLRAFARDHIFTPLGMTQTHFHDDPGMIVPGLAFGYTRGNDGLRVARALDGTVGNAGLYTTVGDLLKWEQNFTDARVGSAELLAAMQKPTPLAGGSVSPYGFGLQIGEDRGRRTIGHGGGDPGASAYGVRYPDQSLAVVVLCNLDEIDSIGLSRQIADRFIPRKTDAAASTSSPPIKLTHEQLARNEGLYHAIPNDALLRMFVRDSVLMGSSGAGSDGGWPLTPLDERRFAIGGTPITIEFVPGASGAVETMRVVGERPTPTVLERLSDYRPSRDVWMGLAGSYASDELDVTYTLIAADQGLELRIPGRRPIALQPIFPDAFAGSLVGVIRFTRDSAGGVTGFVLNAGAAFGIDFRRMRPGA